MTGVVPMIVVLAAITGGLGGLNGFAAICMEGVMALEAL
jgi:hypothetical protein